MATFEQLVTELAPEIAGLKAAFAAKGNSGADMQKYLGLQFQLDQTLRKRGIKGAELDIALKAIMEIVQKA